MIDDPLGRILVERQFLTLMDCQDSLATARSEDCFLEEILIRKRKFPRKMLLKILENEYFCPAIDLEKTPGDPALLSVIPRRLAARHLVFPVGTDGQAIKVAFFNPTDARICAAISQMANRTITPMVALRHDLRDTIKRSYDDMERKLSAETRGKNDQAQQAPTDRRPQVGDRPDVLLSFGKAGEQSATALVDKLVDEASKRGATDIHIESKEQELVVRFRLDGVLCRAAALPASVAASVVSRIKVLGGMDITERRMPQDGRHTMKKGDQLLDLRISSIPSQFGEKIVIRLLSKSKGLLELDNLGMPPAVSEGYANLLQNPQGLFLVTGPTGSGKTTTLYATLNALDCESVNVVTLEDPIEYSFQRITQVQVHEDIGLTFASGLRSFLRQDPDVILVGEIRDVATVEIACRAALTGHKVFSTIHTNDAAQAISRLVEMGAPPYLIAATLKGVLAQRLVRLLCTDCKETYTPNQLELAVLGYPKIDTLHRGRGCKTCSGTGYKGRSAVYEYLTVSENILKLIIERASAFAIQHAARQDGMIPMSEFAKRAVLNGTTSVAEIQRAVLADLGHEQLCNHCSQVVSLDFAVCPFCQHVLKEKCAGCQHPLDPTWEACPNCGLEVESELRKTYCPHCQAPLDGKRESCPFCGGGL
jgi:type II secretory ATPase GspE/PulE/Tfp pilus assembly ATPase PilB-like protein